MKSGKHQEVNKDAKIYVGHLVYEVYMHNLLFCAQAQRMNYRNNLT